VTFDPFSDFETRGYLRNMFGEKDPEIIRHLEHSSFLAGVDQAFERLAKVDQLSYQNVLETHKILFGDMYPWAGQDRSQTAPDLAISKGSVFFAHPNDTKIAVDHALRMGEDKAVMAAKPGEVMGYLAYGHPFLDGNGRAIMVVHTELAERAGISIDWAATDKVEYLTALTREMDSPGKGHLDAYLKPFVGVAIGRDGLASHVARAPGLDGNAQNEVLGKFSDPVFQARYRHQEEQRSGGILSADLRGAKRGTGETASPQEQDKGRSR
jgi:cell filamentation protein